MWEQAHALLRMFRTTMALASALQDDHTLELQILTVEILRLHISAARKQSVRTDADSFKGQAGNHCILAIGRCKDGPTGRD